jgi:hypothetical protein
MQVIDNFLSSAINKEIIDLLKRSKWSFTGGGGSDDFQSYFWHMDNLEKESYFINLFQIIKNKLNLASSSKLLRCYANGQTAGQSGVEHEDDGDLTILYFPDSWQYQWAGHLLFTDGEKIINCIEYKQNRLITFNAKKLHFALAPVNIYLGLRTSLAFKIKF